MIAPTFHLPSGGSLRGVAQANSSAFLGVRFGEPPTGDSRWRPPVASPLLSGVTVADEIAPQCMQRAPPVVNGTAWPMSEDCLFLNIFTPLRAPPQPAQDLLPVLVYIHGGCYVGDGTANTLFNGTHFVELAAARVGGAEPSLLVTVAYRLGAYGFLGGEALRARNAAGGASGDGANATGNWGLQDQRLALRWVRDTIASFGGDAARVTVPRARSELAISCCPRAQPAAQEIDPSHRISLQVFGHSAGAGSVSAHLASPASVGLFARAGMLSGSMANWATHSAEAAEHSIA